MNFLRTQSIQRVADILKLKLDGVLWKSQSILDIRGGRNIAFSQVESKDTTTLTVSVGKDGVFGYWGSFWDTTNQTVTSTTTAYAVTLNSADSDNDGVVVTNGSKVVPTTPGVYNLSVSCQCTNTDTQAHDATFWFRKSGTDIAASASTVTVPSTHGGVDGHMIFYVDIVQRLEMGEYLELYWHATNTAIKLETLPAGTTPTHPVSPSVLMSVVQI